MFKILLLGLDLCYICNMKNYGGEHTPSIGFLQCYTWHLPYGIAINFTLNDAELSGIGHRVYGLASSNDPFIFVHFRGVFPYKSIHPLGVFPVLLHDNLQFKLILWWISRNGHT